MGAPSSTMTRNVNWYCTRWFRRVGATSKSMQRLGSQWLSFFLFVVWGAFGAQSREPSPPHLQTLWRYGATTFLALSPPPPPSPQPPIMRCGALCAPKGRRLFSRCASREAARVGVRRVGSLAVEKRGSRRKHTPRMTRLLASLWTHSGSDLNTKPKTHSGFHAICVARSNGICELVGVEMRVT